MAKKEVPLPKFHIGDCVYYIGDRKITEAKITGVIGLYERYDSNFIGYMYYTRQGNEIHEYGWINEDSLSISRQQLKDSL